MCVWVGCIAKKPCASSLADALEKIEGIWAGYYTGIVTVDGGKLHHAKCACVCGSVSPSKTIIASAVTG